MTNVGFGALRSLSPNHVNQKQEHKIETQATPSICFSVLNIMLFH